MVLVMQSEKWGQNLPHLGNPRVKTAKHAEVFEVKLVISNY